MLMAKEQYISPKVSGALEAARLAVGFPALVTRFKTCLNCTSVDSQPALE